MFIFTLQSSQLSVCVCLRSTDLVMNNLFHAGNTFYETQQSSVETLQSTDWGVLNYKSTALWSSQRNTLTLLSEDVTFICMSQPQTQIQPFYLGWETCWFSSATAEPHRDGYHSLLCVQQLYGNHLRNDVCHFFREMHVFTFTWVLTVR